MVGYNSVRDPAPYKAQPETFVGMPVLFSRLMPDGSGPAQKQMPPAGPYHLNHFICYFTVAGSTYTDAQGHKTAGELTYFFLRHFCHIFSERNIARAQHGPPSQLSVFNGSKTVEFTIGGNVGSFEHYSMGFLHPDWVAMSGVPPLSVEKIDAGYPIQLTSFHGDTLRRIWDTEIEKKLIEQAAGAMAGLSPSHHMLGILPPPFDTLMKAMDKAVSREKVRALLAFNRLHFLAGTRSWRVGYDPVRKQFFVETLTIERFSCAFYEAADTFHSTRQDVIDLWDHLLDNFVNTRALRGYTFESAEPPGDLETKHGYWRSQIHQHVRHRPLALENLEALLNAYIKPDSVEGAGLLMRAIRYSHAGLRNYVEKRPG